MHFYWPWEAKNIVLLSFVQSRMYPGLQIPEQMLFSISTERFCFFLSFQSCLWKHALLGGHEITGEIYDLLEEAPKHAKQKSAAALPYAAGDVIYISATAWKNSFYKINWPYDAKISNAFFEARVEKISKNENNSTYHLPRSNWNKKNLSIQGTLLISQNHIVSG